MDVIIRVACEGDRRAVSEGVGYSDEVRTCPGIPQDRYYAGFITPLIAFYPRTVMTIQAYNVI